MSFLDWLFWLFRRIKVPPRPPSISARLNTCYVKKENRFMSTATINIVLPTTRTNGTAISSNEIAKTDIFDTASPTPLVPIGTVVGPGLSFTTDVLDVGVHNFTAEVTDTTGHQSGMSNVASVTVPATLANPNPPTITATLNP